MNYPSPPSITCPVCRRTSHHPMDVAEGFCGYCHGWTARPGPTDPALEGFLATQPTPDQLAAYRRQALHDPDPDWPDPAGEAVTESYPPPGAAAALDRLRDLVDVPPITEPQAQGNVGILPWPPETAPAWRAQEVDAAEDVPESGVPVDTDRTHVLYAESEPLDRVRYHPTGKGYTRGTLYVPNGSAARLSHRSHGDLLIGPGVYVLRQQRAYTGTRTRRHHTTPAGD